MPKKKCSNNTYDVAYRTTSGRLMVAKRVQACTAEAAKTKLKREMRASKTFDKVITTIKL